jgi:endo-1,3-1,4-beta-glycanase ExoK
LSLSLAQDGHNFYDEQQENTMNKLRYLGLLGLIFFAACKSSAIAANDGFFEHLDKPDKTNWNISSGWANGPHQGCEWREEEITYNNEKMQLGLSDRGGKVRPIGCSEIHTNKRLGYGLYEARLKSVAGSGLNTGFFTYIGPPNGVPEWDEIDFEFLGKDSRTVSINHFTNGKAYDGKLVQLGFDASANFHNYAFDWSPNKIRWYADGKLVAETADNSPIPHNPGMMFLTLWSGAQPEDAWMGSFHYTGPTAAEVEWAAYTPPDKPCQFPESLKCKQKQ